MLPKPSAYGDVELRFLKRASTKFGFEIEEDASGERCFISIGKHWALLDLVSGMVSGLSIETACSDVGVDCLALYMEIARQDDRESRRR